MKKGIDLGNALPVAALGLSAVNQFHSFPSRHTTLMWAAVTPYAKEYGASWLYGVAAITNAARVGSREHWLSDTVGGAALGYVLGSLAWEARRESRRSKDGPTVVAGPNEVALKWTLD